MANCLVLKLNGKIENNNLPYFGEIRLTSTADYQCTITPSAACKIIDGDGTITEYSKGDEIILNFTAGETKRFVSKYESIFTTNNYLTNNLFVDTIDFGYLKNADDITNFTFRGSEKGGLRGDVCSLFSSSKLTSLLLHGNKKLTVSNFKEFLKKYPSLYTFYNENTYVIGTWKELAEVNTNMRNLQGPIEGDIYEYIKIARANGKTTGKISKNRLSSSVDNNVYKEYFGGDEIPNAVYGIIEWTSNTITLKHAPTTEELNSNPTIITKNM